jgi:hypothetical protein
MDSMDKICQKKTCPPGPWLFRGKSLTIIVQPLYSSGRFVLGSALVTQGDGGVMPWAEKRIPLWVIEIG